MSCTILVSLLALIAMSCAQRPGYAGSRPYGYPVIVTTTAATTTAAANDLGNRFGNGNLDFEISQSTTTERLPVEANGDRQLLNYLSKLPRDQQPFWFLNWQALEQYRQQPQTYQVKVNNYIDVPPMNGQEPSLNSRSMYMN